MYAFTYERPKNVDEAVKLLKKAKDGKILAGGQTLLPAMKLRLASPDTIVDLSRVKGLSGIKASSKAVTIGALTKHIEVMGSAEVQKSIPALAHLASLIGDPAVRNRGTIGGSLANNDPSADYPAAALGLGATIKTNKRELPADKFFKGLFETALAGDEIIESVSFPVPEKAGYEKFPNPASRFALVGVFVSKSKDGVRVAVTGAGEGGVFRVKEMETALAKDFSAKAIEGIKVPAKNMIADIHGTAEYRAHLIGVMARRAVAAAK
ncbi:MAG: xanthine dehydrogenase family protein subunit M [Rhizobiales bacterium]|jgi:carbon-monoxide dehydrogenase medium subunit|nr:xanthine dehydrogenase family protein subunit M [Hyphomicrobiales bacterium]